MKPNKKEWVLICIIFTVFAGSTLGLAGLILFKPINNGLKNKNEIEIHNLPAGYTLNKYQIEKVLDSQCQKDDDCELPMDYAIQSRCPFTALCLNNKCNVVCPGKEETRR